MATTTIKLTPVNVAERKALDIRAGDTVRVHQKIQEKGKTRIQLYEGLVLAVKHGKEQGGTFTVRKVMSGVGVEKIFPIYSPSIEKIEIVRRSKVRRAKLYYIREKVAREIRRKMRRMMNVPEGAVVAADDIQNLEGPTEEQKVDVAESEAPETEVAAADSTEVAETAK